jgi:hypothetical protein
MMNDQGSLITTVNFRTPNYLPDVVSWDDWDSPWIAETETEIIAARERHQKRIERNHEGLLYQKKLWKMIKENSIFYTHEENQPWNDYKRS